MKKADRKEHDETIYFREMIIIDHIDEHKI